MSNRWAEFDVASQSLETATSHGERRDALERQLRAVARQRGITSGDVEALPLSLWDPGTVRRAMAEGKKQNGPLLAWQLGAWAQILSGEDRQTALNAALAAFELLAVQPTDHHEAPFCQLAPALDLAQTHRALADVERMLAAGWGVEARRALAVLTARLDALGQQAPKLADEELETWRSEQLAEWRTAVTTFAVWSTW
jgi:hypothetical protein